MSEYTIENPLRVVELFAGIGAQASALERLGIPFTSTVCEIDPKAYRAYCAIHGETPNLGDITKVEHLPECDLVTYSFPCTDISVAGQQMGFAKGSGTRSGLLWEVERLLDDMNERKCLPEVLVMENVDAILNKKNFPDFMQWVNKLKELGYTNSYDVLNAKDFGVPQNRKRVFMVSTLHMGEFVFPKGFPLQKRLKDILEEDVPESYYLSQERIAKYERHKKRQEELGTGFGYRPLDIETEDCINAVTTKPQRNATGNLLKESNPNPDDELKLAGNLNIPGQLEYAQRVYDPDGVSPTVKCSQGGGTMAKIEVDPGIELAGDLHEDGRLEQHNRVYGADGVSPTLYTPHGGDKSPKIEVAGDLNLDGKLESSNRVYGADGIAPTIPAACGMGGGITPKIEVEDTEKIIKIGDLNNGSNQNGIVYDPNGLSPALMASAGEKANHIRIDVSSEVDISGEIMDSDYEQGRRVYDPNGVAPSILARDGKEPKKIDVTDIEDEAESSSENDDPSIVVDRILGKNTQHYKVYDPEGVAPTIAACDEKDPCKVITHKGEDTE